MGSPNFWDKTDARLQKPAQNRQISVLELTLSRFIFVTGLTRTPQLAAGALPAGSAHLLTLPTSLF